jgi:nitrogen fixation protein
VVDVVSTLRAAHAQLIAQNPVTVTVVRSDRQDDGAGGWIEQTRSWTVELRLVPEHTQPTIQTNEAGVIGLTGWSFYAPWDADIQEDDEFTTDSGRRFNVIRVEPRSFNGLVYAVNGSAQEVT